MAKRSIRSFLFLSFIFLISVWSHRASKQGKEERKEEDEKSPIINHEQEKEERGGGGGEENGPFLTRRGNIGRWEDV